MAEQESQKAAEQPAGSPSGDDDSKGGGEEGATKSAAKQAGTPSGKTTDQEAQAAAELPADRPVERPPAAERSVTEDKALRRQAASAGDPAPKRPTAAVGMAAGNELPLHLVAIMEKGSNKYGDPKVRPPEKQVHATEAGTCNLLSVDV